MFDVIHEIKGCQRPGKEKNGNPQADVGEVKQNFDPPPRAHPIDIIHLA
jgi:hypothetical protein